VSALTCAGSFTEYGAGTSFTNLGVAATNPGVTGTVAAFSIAWSGTTSATVTITPSAGGAASYGLTRYPISGTTIASAPSWAPQTGWWYSPTYGGTGWFMEAQNSSGSGTSATSNYFLVGYAYGATGKPTWWAGGATLSQLASLGSTIATAAPVMYEFAAGPALTGTTGTTSILAERGSVTLSCSAATACSLVLPNGQRLSIQRYTAF
jgi:hypothetical protein